MGAVLSMYIVNDRLSADADSGAAAASDEEAAVSSLVEAVPAAQPPDAPPLIAAAAARDRAAVLGLLRAGGGLNAANGSGLTPLHWAVSAGDVLLVQRLLALAEQGDARLWLDAADGHGFTALHYAAVTCQSFAAHVLVAAGASVNLPDWSGQTPLMKAAKRNDVALCRALLDAGADLAAADNFGQTVLHWAASAGGLSTRLLLGRGAVAASDKRGRTPLGCALRAKRLDAARALLPAAVFRPRADETGRNELHWAAAHGTADIVRQLLSCGLRRWPRDHAGMTPLMRALEARNVGAAEALLEAAERYEGVANRAGNTALHLAARAGLARAVRRLLHCGCDAWRPDGDGRDALMLAVLSGDREAAAAVLRHAGLREYADRHGRSALQLAVRGRDAGIVLDLLKHGANPNCADLAGLTPLALATHLGFRDIVEILHCSRGRLTPVYPAE